jgi:hypothetical protein
VSVRFLSARGWVDEDGRHVWVAHDCVGGRERTMLPYPTWKADGTRISPSVICGDCGMHAFVDLGPVEAEALDAA